jgi:hypothetical protein
MRVFAITFQHGDFGLPVVEGADDVNLLSAFSLRK